MRNKLKEIIGGLIDEVMNEQPAPVIEPPTKPQSPPAPVKPSTRPNPLKPTRPGIAPRPKALSHDVEAFLNRRKSMAEAIDIGDLPDLIDPSKRSKIEDEKDYVEQILPDLGPEADRYLEIITSESYKQNIQRIAHYLNISVAEIQNKFPNYPTIMMLAFKTLRDISNIESSYHDRLQQMAIDVVLDLDEYKHVKPMVERGEIILDVKFGGADLSKAITADKLNEELPSGLTVAETLNMQLNNALEGESEGKLRRALANFMTQGDAVNKLFLFNQISDALSQINPSLPNKYGILAALTQLSYYITPHIEITSDIVNMAAVGSEQVIPTGDKYTIKVRAATFPYLVHELVKGFGDFISMDVASQDELDTETMDDEIKQIMAGPALEMKLRKLIPVEKIELLPIIKKLFYSLEIPKIKEILLGGKKARKYMDELISQAEESV